MSRGHLCLLGDATSVHVRRWAQEMRARDFRVSLVTARPEPIEGVGQSVLTPVARSSDWLFRVGEARRAVDALAPDIVHAHYITSYGYLAAACDRHPLVMTAWGSDLLVSPKTSRAIRWLTGRTLRRADLITGDSVDLIDAIAAYRPAAAPQLIHWGADLQKFAPASWAGKTGFQVVSLRAWEPNYRIDTIVEAFGQFARRHPDVGARLHLLGGGSLEPVLRRLVEALELGRSVAFHGRVDDAAMAAVLAACRVSVSVPDSDATSVSVLESMACGLPVVATDLPANRAWLADADSRLLVPRHDAAAITTAFESLWQDDARAETIGARHLVRMRRDGSRTVQMDRMATLYARLLASDPVP